MKALLKRMAVMFVAVFLIALIFNLGVSFAQDAPAPAVPWWKMLLDMALISVLPALWTAVGPTVTAFITAGVNKLSSAYVPRPVQVVLSAIFTAGLAGIAGDPVAMVQAGISGASGQIIAATPPSVFLTEEKPK